MVEQTTRDSRIRRTHEPGMKTLTLNPRNDSVSQAKRGPNIKHIREEPLRSHLAPLPDANCTAVMVATCHPTIATLAGHADMPPPLAAIRTADATAVAVPHRLRRLW